MDYESGASGDKQANTDAIRRVKVAGYTPMYYSYKPYTLENVVYKRIIKEFPNSFWIAEYPNYEVTPVPNYIFSQAWTEFQYSSSPQLMLLEDLTGMLT